MEGDAERKRIHEKTMNFNPLPPHGGRHSSRNASSLAAIISIHSLRMEGDHPRESIYTIPDISIHSLRMEGDNIRII